MHKETESKICRAQETLNYLREEIKPESWFLFTGAMESAGRSGSADSSVTALTICDSVNGREPNVDPSLMTLIVRVPPKWDP